MKLRRVSKNRISTLKNKLWPLVSKFNRQKDADHDGYVVCVTCGKTKHWKEGDAGHFIDGRRNAIVYDPRNIHFQCKPCNGSFLNNYDVHGQLIEPHMIKVIYEKYMVERYGQEEVDDLKRLNKKDKQWTVRELEELIEAYIQK